MAIILFLLPLGLFFSLYFDLWAIAAFIVLSFFFVAKKIKIPAVIYWFFVFYIFSLLLNFFIPAQFENSIFALQIVLCAVFFVAGYNIADATPPVRTVFNLIAPVFFIVFPFVKTNLNPNVVSSFLALFVLFVWMSDLKQAFKIVFVCLGVFFIARNGSVVALFSLFCGFAAWRRKKVYWLLVFAAAVAVLFAEENSIVERIVWLGRAFGILKRHPLGIGFFSAKYFLPATGVQNTIFVHSFLAQFLLEGGVVAAVLLISAAVDFLKNLRRDARWAIAAGFVLAALDYSFYYVGCGMIFSFIAGNSLKREANFREYGFLRKLVFYLMFFSALVLSAVMFSSSRNFARGNFWLFKNPSKALYFYEKISSFPRIPAGFAARAAAKSIIGQRNDDKKMIAESFVLAEKALVFRDVRNPAYRDFLAAKKKGNLGKLRAACGKILFLNGIVLKRE
ncbi:MAG: hypothetical protein J7L54_02395 [Elusimicrobia bacterium]|nr:hypothetical protein [Elusimicrobiota bacterium]